MESFTVILNLLEIPSSVFKELIWLYQHSTNNEKQHCKLQCTVNKETQVILKESLLGKPYETCRILDTLQKVYIQKHLRSFIDIIYTTIVYYLEMYSEESQTEVDSNTIYTLISLLEYCDEIDDLKLRKIFNFLNDLSENNKLNKDIVYLCLLPQKNLRILKQFLNFEQEFFNNCCITDSSSLFRYSLYKNKHWLFHILDKEIPSLSNQKIYEKLLLLKLNYITNLENINYMQISDILTKIPSRKVTTDIFLQFYITEIRWNLELYHFISKKTLKTVEKFKIVENTPCLDILSNYFDIKDLNNYENINEILIKHEEYLTVLRGIKKSEEFEMKPIQELDVYNGFCLLKVFEYVMLYNKKDDIHEMLKKIKHQFLQSKDQEFKLEVLENIFTMLFLQNKIVYPDKSEDNTFICSKNNVFFIASFLKSILKEIKRKYNTTEEKLSKFYIRLSNLINNVSDCLWRLELLKSQKVIEEDAKNTINLMLSSANSLIYLCLENDNFEKAHEIIQVYKIQDTYIAQEIDYIEKIKYFKTQKHSHDIIKFCAQNIHEAEMNPNKQSVIKEDEILLLLDVALTSENSFEVVQQLFNSVLTHGSLESYDYLNFCSNIYKVYEEIGPADKISVARMLRDHKYPLNPLELSSKQKYYKKLETVYYNNDKLNKTNYLELSEICSDWNKNTINYLNRLYNYLKRLQDLQHQENTTIFNLITKNPAEIVGELIFLQNVQPKTLEKIFTSLKLDIIYYIAWNCLPEIELNTLSESTKKKLDIDINTIEFEDYFDRLKNSYDFDASVDKTDRNLTTPDVFLLSYIRKRNWLLAYLLNKTYLLEEAKLDVKSERTKHFNILLNLNSTHCLKVLFKTNNILTVLNNNPIPELIKYLDKIIKITNWDEVGKWIEILNLLSNLSERILEKNWNIHQLQDLIIYNIISNNKILDSSICNLVEKISNNKLRFQCIIGNYKNWNGDFCIKILNSELLRWDLNAEDKQLLQEKFYEIELYDNIKTAFNLNSWNEVYEKSISNSDEIFLRLLNTTQIVLLLKWIDIHKPVSTNLLHLITEDYFILILEEETDLNYIKTLLSLLQFDHRIQICKNLIKTVRKIDHLTCIIDYLINLLPELESEYKNIEISLKILSFFNQSEHEYIFCLVNKPLLIIEQLIMNVRLEKLNAILIKIKPILCDSQERNIPVDITIEGIDYLVRNYAKKSLDFRGIQPTGNIKNIELKLMQSLDTLSCDSERKAFVMPEKVPEKSNWVQNEQALECMCCREVTFSMFNRRHHCRRCGRVICGNCSHKKLEIQEYGQIPVRACNDCFKQSQSDDSNYLSNKSEYSSNKSGSINFWLLTDDDKHNDIAREEFSYEYAPSVSLCLSILKLHSNSPTYPRFLLEQCKILLPYLQDAISEIDFSFIIQMVKSLVMAAKITSINHSFKSELAQCNELLLHIELVSLLVEKDCLDLLRTTNKTQTNEFYINAGVLRRLRDKLLEQEQWDLALEISTKVGLDKTGIFAAWGKSCLRAGCLKLAREKFQYCLERITVYDTSIDLTQSLSMSTDFELNKSSQHRSVNLSIVSENRPLNTPPLVNEIITVLETSEYITDRSVFKSFDDISLNSSTLSLNINCPSMPSDPAVCILNKLKNLKALSSSSASNTRARKNSRVSLERFSNSSNVKRQITMDPCFYKECLYYLNKYASHSTILQFYIKHQKIDKALHHILDSRLSTDYFIEIYMKCLEDSKIELLQDEMQKIDCSLHCWQMYLKAVCRHLELNSMYNVLYQLQIFICDFVRAAMTCIKFYQENANSFKELFDREEYLQMAQNHLKQELEQEQWVQVTPVRKSSTTSSGSSQSSTQPSLVMKLDPRNIDRYINTIWMQIEIAKFLAECESDSPTLEILNEIFPPCEDGKKQKIPTLFDSAMDKTKLATLAVVCGKNIETGFGTAFRIIQEHNLKYLKIYCLAGKYLAQILRETAVMELISCIKSSGLSPEIVSTTCDEVLIISVTSLTKANGSGTQLDNLIKLINDPGVKIDAYIEIKQLKRAYLLAVRYSRTVDIKKILREAEKNNQPQIKAICLKWLTQNGIS